MEENKIFWLDEFNGEAKGGFFIRNDLKKFFEKLEETGLNPVAIKYNGSFNLEVIVERNEKYIELYEKE